MDVLTSRERRNLKESSAIIDKDHPSQSRTQDDYFYKIIHDLQADNRRLQDENYKLREQLLIQTTTSKLRVGRANNTAPRADYYVSGRVL